MKQLVIALALLACCGTAQAQIVTLPATAQGPSGLPVMLQAKADGKNVTWLAPDAGIVILDGGSFGGDSTKAAVFGKDGTYRVWAITAKGDTVSPVAECKVTIGTVPPGPGPGPGPQPPNDTLTQDVQAAWAQETDAAKLGQAQLLASLYSYMASSAGLGNVTTVTDWAQAVKLLDDKGAALGVNGKLLVVQGAVAKNLVAAVPALASGSGAIVAADRKAATEFFGKAAAAVGALK